MQNIFVTGASGFIGSNLVRKLIENGHHVTALTRDPNSLGINKIEILSGDILDIESFQRIIGNCDLVFHCAAFISFRKQDFQRAYQVNVMGTRNLLEAAQENGIKKVVHLSAGAVLGIAKNKDTIMDEAANPDIKKDNIYAYTKKMAEAEVQKYVRQGLNVSIANISTVYGKGDRKLNSGALIKSILAGKMKFIPPGGTSYVAVDDLVSGLILLAQKGLPGERYIFATENLEYKDLFRRIASTIGASPPSRQLPKSLYYPMLGGAYLWELLARVAPKGSPWINTQIIKEIFGYKYFSSEKSKKDLGWNPEHNLEYAVMQAWEFYQQQGMI